MFSEVLTFEVPFPNSTHAYLHEFFEQSCFDSEFSKFCFQKSCFDSKLWMAFKNGMHIPDGIILCTIDVLGLYPNIPHEERLQALRKRLET